MNRRGLWKLAVKCCDALPGLFDLLLGVLDGHRLFFSACRDLVP
jgi:hypothetical protein